MENALLRYVIVPHPERPAALLLPAESGWTLPFVNLPGHSFPMTGVINQGVREELGLAIVILRWLYRHETAPGVIADRVYAADNLSPDWAPPLGEPGRASGPDVGSAGAPGCFRGMACG